MSARTHDGRTIRMLTLIDEFTRECLAIRVARLLTLRRHRMDTSSQSLRLKTYREFKDGLIITLYLWLIFGLLILHKSMILAEHHIDFTYHGLALMNALALAKVMLVSKHLHLGHQSEDKPLIYPTLLKSTLFTAVLACFKILEDAVVGWYRHESFRQSIHDLGGGTWQGTLTLALLIFVLLVPFVGIGELAKVLGEGELQRIFFRHIKIEALQGT